jgi:hypothetical protein
VVANTEQSGFTIEKFGRWRAAVLGLALILQLAFSALHFEKPVGDAAEYSALAVNLVRHDAFALPVPGEASFTAASDTEPDTRRDGVRADVRLRPTARRMPLYPLFVALLCVASGTHEPALIVPPVQGLLMVANVALIIALGRRFFGDLVALVAGLFASLYQAYLYLPTQIITETLYLTLLLLVLIVLTRPKPVRMPALVAGFVLMGGLILTRANAVALVPVVLVWAWRTLRGTRARPAKIGLLIVCLLVPLVPWWVRNAVTFGRFIPLSTNGGWNFFLGHNPGYRDAPGLGRGTDYGIFDRLVAEERTEVEVDRELYGRGLAFIRDHPAEAIGNVARKARAIFSVYVRETWTFVFAVMVVLGLMTWRAASNRSARYRAVGVGLITAAVLLWVWQVAEGLAQAQGLTRTGISFGLLAGASLAGLVVAFRRSRNHWLLPAVYLSQVVVCLIYVPVVRIRWSVDVVVIVYAAVAVSALAVRLTGGPGRSGQPGPAAASEL